MQNDFQDQGTLPAVPPKIGQMLREALYRQLPLFMAAETTGVGKSDVITALSLMPLAGEARTLYFPLPPDKKETALKFLQMSEADHARQTLVTYDGIKVLLDAVHEASGRHGMLAPITYNVPFQLRFLSPTQFNDAAGRYVVAAPLDLTRTAWCIENAPAFARSASPGMSLADIQRLVEEFAHKRKGSGYKDVFPKWGIDLPAPLPPLAKPELLQRLLVTLTGETSPETLLRTLGFERTMDFGDLADTVNATRSIESISL